MIRRTLPQGRQALRRRDAFTLLEVLVVVAIIVILATVSSIYIFRYLDDAKIDTAKQNMTNLEKACKSYMLKSGGVPPPSLQELITPSDGGKPFVEGGASALNDPWGNQFQYNPQNVNASGDPDPMVFCTNPSTKVTYLSLSRQQQQQ